MIHTLLHRVCRYSARLPPHSDLLVPFTLFLPPRELMGLFFHFDILVVGVLDGDCERLFPVRDWYAAVGEEEEGEEDVSPERRLTRDQKQARIW